MNTLDASNNIAHATPTAATFLSLPIEIKTQIIECCKNADDNYFRRLNHDISSIAELPELLLKGNRWQGRSLNSLLLVNKELSNLCKILLFRILSSEHFIESNKFIIFKHRHLFRSVTFSDDSTPSQLQDLTYFLVNLSSLNSMILSRFASEYAFGKQNRRSQEELYRFELLCSVGAAITKLRLESYNLNNGLDFLLAFPNLRTLQIDNIFTDELEGEDVETPTASGIQLAKLQLYSLILKLQSLGSISKQWLELDWCSNLRNLSFQSHIIDDSHLEFINKFSNSLQSLTIKSTNLFTTFGTVTLTPLPKLKHLSIELPSPSFEVMLPLFNLSCHLTTLRCESFASTFDALVLDQTLAVLLQPQSSLKSLVICGQYLQPSKFPKVNAICIARAISLKYELYEDDYVEEIDDPEMILPHYQPILREALEFGTRKLQQMERESDAQGMVEMFEKCQWLRATAAEMKD